MNRSSDAKAFINRKVNETAPARSPYFAKPTPADRILQYSLLLLIPDAITPNMITFFRYVSIPIVVALLISDQFVAGLTLFAIAAVSDAVDGAIARTENEITAWGVVNDPLADKLLIGSVAVIVISQFINPWLAGTIVGIELLLVVSAYVRYKGSFVPAKTVGKTKMVLQCLGVFLLMLGVVIDVPVLIEAATYTLYAAVAMALLSLVVYRSI